MVRESLSRVSLEVFQFPAIVKQTDELEIKMKRPRDKLKPSVDQIEAVKVPIVKLKVGHNVRAESF